MQTSYDPYTSNTQTIQGQNIMTAGKARQLPPSVELVDEELQAEAPMRIKISANDPDRLFVQFQKDSPLMDGHCISIDAGRRKWKIGYWKNPKLLIIDRFCTDLATIPANSKPSNPPGNPRANGVRQGFLSRNKANISEKNRVTITYQGKTYATGTRAQKLGGERGLGEKKTVNLLERVLCALTLHGIMSGKVYLILTIPFEGEDDWQTQETIAFNAIAGRQVWESDKGGHDVEIVPFIAPEAFYADRYPRLLDAGYPDWEKVPRYVFDFGDQTFIKAAFGFDYAQGGTFFDADLSECFDGYGLSLFYKYVAEKARIGSSEDPAFVEAVNRWFDKDSPDHPLPSFLVDDENGDRWFVCQEGKFSLETPINLALDQYQSDIFKLTKFSPGFTHFLVVGGGANWVGERFCQEYSWAESFVPELPDLANIIGQSKSFQQVFVN